MGAGVSSAYGSNVFPSGTALIKNKFGTLK
jgi:hypothetical protein